MEKRFFDNKKMFDKIFHKKLYIDNNSELKKIAFGSYWYKYAYWLADQDKLTDALQSLFHSLKYKPFDKKKLKLVLKIFCLQFKKMINQ